jgi:hypothetical protein
MFLPRLHSLVFEAFKRNLLFDLPLTLISSTWKVLICHNVSMLAINASSPGFEEEVSFHITFAAFVAPIAPQPLSLWRGICESQNPRYPLGKLFVCVL